MESIDWTEGLQSGGKSVREAEEKTQLYQSYLSVKSQVDNVLDIHSQTQMRMHCFT